MSRATGPSGHVRKDSVDLRRYLSARMLPLVVLLAVLVSLSAPLAYFVLTVRTLRTRAEATAVQVASAISREIQDRPVLWRYDAYKLLAHIRAFTEETSIARIEIVDRSGVRVPLDDQPLGRRTGAEPLMWESAPIEINEQVVGHAWTGVVLDEARAGALLLLIPFGALGLGLASLIYFIPGRAMARATRRIDQSQAALARFNQTLEQQVAERSSQLSAAYTQLQAKEERLRELSSRALLLQEAERRVIARELHDSAGQALTAIRINLQIIAQLAEAGARGSEKVAGLAARTLTIADATLEEIRRAVSMLGPAILDDVGLVAAIQRLCDDLGERADTIIDCELDAPPASGLSPALESACYRVIQEALTNVARHARATRVVVRLALAPRKIHLEVHDNGRGFDPSPTRPAGSVGGRGLVGMRERVELLGGTLRIDSAPDMGTHVIVDLPQVTLSEDGDDTAVVVA
ncbi:sensor histidine kinase [Nannocystis sp.]|uniref:sensor histidine kinase n=1 Tax=Nannocystis sp. TaxID=1962667 RepID=UPI0025F2AFBF|nr:sensor histidine kinase [Nannocystis sp.]MBK7824505.1 sensor histidine kinase [Nannocystis sp.]